MSIHLFKRAADWRVCPLCTAQVNELLAKCLVGILRLAIVDAGQLLAEEALLSTVTSESASTGLMLRCEMLSVARCCQQQAGCPGHSS